MDFKLVSEYSPTGDQPQAIEQLVEGVKNGEKDQTLLGVTGSGKTFTIANVIKEVNKPTLILSHNKTLAAQLYSEFKAFFPYYDYYQPEAYLPVTDTFIEKDLQINDEIEKLRLHTTSSLLSGRRDVIVVSSVSCIYGIGNPAEFYEGVSSIAVGEVISRNKFLHGLVESLYSRTTAEFTRGTFRVKGDTVDIYLAYTEVALRVVFWGDEIESIETFENSPLMFLYFPALNFSSRYFRSLSITSKDTINKAINEIQDDMMAQTEYFSETGKHLEAKRLKSRVEYDLEMMRELGYCSGIENYSRYFDRRQPGTRPFCLLDYFPKDFRRFWRGF